MKNIWLLLPMFLLCAACSAGEMEAAREKPSVTPFSVPAKDMMAELPPEEPVYVSPLAVEELLLPLEEFSWEREHPVELVMLHFTSAVMVDREGPYDMTYIRDIFEGYGASIHYIVDRDGTVWCYLPEDRVAWHAGKGEYGDDPRYTNDLNRYSIGIEIAAIGSQADMAQYLTEREYAALDPALIGFTDAQYASLRVLGEDICTRNGVPMDRTHVIGHSEYSPAKADPGELFDWSRIIS